MSNKQLSNIELGFKLDAALMPGESVLIITDSNQYAVVVSKNAIDDVCCSCECTFVQFQVPGMYVVDLRLDWYQYSLEDETIFILRDSVPCPSRFNGEVVREIHTQIK